jgi:hypothetical protein
VILYDEDQRELAAALLEAFKRWRWALSEQIRTFCAGRELTVLWDTDEEDIDGYVKSGFIPIEMAAGEKSYVDHRLLDHHNEYSGLPSACVSVSRKSASKIRLRYAGGSGR